MPISENGITQINIHLAIMYKANFEKYLFTISCTFDSSTTESFLKAKTSYSSNFRQNEKATRYQMISEIDLKLYNMQKTIDLFI